MMTKRKARNREQRMKPGAAEKLTSVRVTLTQMELTRLRQLERERQVTREEIFRLGLRNIASG